MWLLDRVMRVCGYVPKTEMEAALARKEVESGQVTQVLERDLRHTKRNLAQVNVSFSYLESEVEYLRQLGLAHANGSARVCRAVNRLDQVSANLVAYMQDNWPDAIVSPVDPAPEEAPKPTTA